VLAGVRVTFGEIGLGCKALQTALQMTETDVLALAAEPLYGLWLLAWVFLPLLAQCTVIRIPVTAVEAGRLWPALRTHAAAILLTCEAAARAAICPDQGSSGSRRSSAASPRKGSAVSTTSTASASQGGFDPPLLPELRLCGLVGCEQPPSVLESLGAIFDQSGTRLKWYSFANIAVAPSFQLAAQQVMAKEAILQ